MMLLGWIGTVITLGGYVWSVRSERPGVFDLANVIAFGFIAASCIAVGAWPSLVVTVSFGLIGAWGLWRRKFYL